MSMSMSNLILANNEKHYPLTEAYEIVTGRRHALSVPWRHSQYGLRGIFLEFVMSGGKRQTSVEAVKRFFESQTNAVSPKQKPDSSNAKSVAKADREIDLLTAPAKRGRRSKTKTTVA